MSTPTESTVATPLPRPGSGMSPPAASGSDRERRPAMDPAVTTIQPGGGVVMGLELAWGRLRRRYLRTFRPAYVARMADRRQGERGDLPFDPVDARDMKYYRNQACYWWADADDPFLWRDSLPFMRVALAELFVIGGGLLLLGVVLAAIWWPLVFPPLIAFVMVVWFFRDPRRAIPIGAGTVVAPADGKIVEMMEIDDPVIGPAVQFGVYLSILNVHANRASLPGRVVSVQYQAGKFFNAMRRQSARQNERLDLEIVSPELEGRTIRICQITGPFARRVVCWARVGDVFSRGEMYGMIKLGSRTELVIPRDPSLVIDAQVGDRIQAGTTVLARYLADRIHTTMPDTLTIDTKTS